MTDTLKPCPFCGGEAVEVFVGDTKSFGMCMNEECACLGPSRPDEAGAAEVWNQRTANNGSTHWEGCWRHGRRHYDCAVAEIGRLHEKLALQLTMLGEAHAKLEEVAALARKEQEKYQALIARAEANPDVRRPGSRLPYLVGDLLEAVKELIQANAELKAKVSHLEAQRSELQAWKDASCAEAADFIARIAIPGTGIHYEVELLAKIEEWLHKLSSHDAEPVYGDERGL